MSFSKIFTLAAAAFALTASAVPLTPRGSGAVEIKNNLAEPVYLWSVSNEASEMQTVASGDSYVEQWRINPNGGGVSIKVSPVSDTSSVLQFEYTKSESDNKLYWDLSSIDLSSDSALITAGFGVTIDDDSCPIATCAPGDVDCAESYQFPDDHNTRACSADAAFTLNLG